MSRTPDKPKPKLQASHVYRDIKELVWPRRKLFVFGLLLTFVNRAAGLVTPWASRYLIDDVVLKHHQQLLVPLVAAVGGAVVVQAVTSFALVQILSTSAQRLITEMRVRVQEHIGRLSVRYYDQNKTGALVSRIMSDVEGVRNLVGTGLVELVGGVFTAVIAFVFLIRINFVLTVFALLFLGLFATIMRSAMKKIRPMFRERSVIYADVTGRLTESLGGVRVVKGFHAEKREAQVFESGAMRLFDNVRKTLLAQSTISFASTILMGIVTVTVMWIGGRMMGGGVMTLGEFFSYSLYMGFLIAPVFQVVGIASQLTEAFAGLDRMHEVMSEIPEDVDPERVKDIGEIKGEVSFDHVNFEYEAEKPVLHDISLEAVPGTVTALVGTSGSGKSTLIGLVAAFAKPKEGIVRVDGLDLSQLRLQSYRAQLGVVLQDNFLFDGTIKENIVFGRPTASDEDVFLAAQIARVDEFALKMEKGYDTVIGERGVKLSGGQRQRVAIARAVLANPRILILDEATSSLDTESEAFIQEGLSALMRGRTTFVIAHRLSTIRTADQILVMENGRILERGTHRQLLQLRGRYFDLYTKQAGIEANRFLNPGEIPVETQVDSKESGDRTTERGSSLTESTRTILGL